MQFLQALLDFIIQSSSLTTLHVPLCLVTQLLF